MGLDSLIATLTNIFHFLIVLGLAVIFHEWGHFIVAKLAGAKVDRFAVGFGKVLFSYKWHDTEYCLCALPLGGFVKIRGMDFEEELTGAEWEYLQLPAWRRILIVLAGPMMNIVLAFLIYILIYFSFGVPYRATTTIGHVPVGSWGWEMGLRDGDRIVSVNGEAVESWEEIRTAQADIGKENLILTINRDGETLTKQKEIPDYFREPSAPLEERPMPPESVEGIFITDVLTGSPAERAGIKAGHIIKAIDGETFEGREEWSDFIAGHVKQDENGEYKPDPMSITLLDEEGNTQTFDVTPSLVFPAEDAEVQTPQARLGFTYDSEISISEYLMPTISPLGVTPKIPPVIGGVQEGSPADKAGLTGGSTIVKMNDQPVDDWVDVILNVHGSLKENEDGSATAQPIQVTWLTPNNEMKQATITPNVVEQPILTRTSMKTGKTYNMAQLGIDVKSDRRKMGVAGAIINGWHKLIHDTSFMIDFLGNLFTGNVSPKLLGGPIAIYQLSGETGSWGIERLLSFIALLSANLALINLFPLPPFDGGHIVFYIIEMIRMKPLTMRQMEMFGKIGAILVIPLILFLIINDLNRAKFFSWLTDLFF